MTLQELNPGDRFRIRKNGSVWIKLYEQGMYNQISYCRSEEKSNTRCQRMSYKHKYLETSREVFEKLPKIKK